MTYYSTVGGWCLTYLFEAIMGNAASSDLAMLEKTFLKTVSTPVSAIFYQTLFLAITAGVLIFGVNKGIERMSKVLMPLLFVLMIVLIIRGLTLPGAWEGLKFLFSPKWDQVTANSLLNAMGFTFFSLSVGMGIMVTYGSYISHKENLTTTALWVSVLAFISCILAGLMVIPPVISFGLNPSAGPGLTFITMPAVFSHIPLGDVFAVCFYGCLLVAALTSMISLFEVPPGLFNGRIPFLPQNSFRSSVHRSFPSALFRLLSRWVRGLITRSWTRTFLMRSTSSAATS